MRGTLSEFIPLRGFVRENAAPDAIGGDDTDDDDSGSDEESAMPAKRSAKPVKNRYRALPTDKDGWHSTGPEGQPDDDGMESFVRSLRGRGDHLAGSKNLVEGLGKPRKTRNLLAGLNTDGAPKKVNRLVETLAVVRDNQFRLTEASYGDAPQSANELIRGLNIVRE